MFFDAKILLLISINICITFPSLALPANSYLKVSSSSDHNESSILLCADGKGPLLEGEGNVLPCAGECPQGFDCELFSNGARTGICCPNVTELSKLYNSESNIDSLPGLLEAIGFSFESRDTAVQSAPKQDSHPDKDALSLIQTSGAIIRHRQPNGQSTSVHSTAAAAQLEAESFSCKRQSLKLYCENGHRPTQFVLRWFHREGLCLSYPWGYCPGQPVASDVTLRTKEECELLCAVVAQQPPKKDVKLAGPPLSSREFDLVERETQLDMALTTSKELGKGPKLVKSGQPSLLGPWHLSSPFSGEEAVSSPAFREPPVVHPQQPPQVLVSNKVADQQMKESRHLRELHRGDKSTEEMGRGSRPTGIVVSQEGDKLQSKKRCEKVTPYRAMCRDMPSQFTLRWHSPKAGGMCIAYPYGYCHGESVYEEEPIKTEEECMEVCVKRRA